MKTLFVSILRILAVFYYLLRILFSLKQQTGAHN